MTERAPTYSYFVPEWETMSRHDLEAGQLRLVLDCLRQVYETNPFYQRLWRRASVDLDKIDSFESFRNMIPAIDKQSVLDAQIADPPFGSILGVERSQLASMWITSGTTGIGEAAFGLTANDVAVAGKSGSYWWNNAGLRAGDVVIFTYPVSFLGAGQLCIASAQEYGLVPIYGFGVDKRLLLEFMEQFDVAMLFATPPVLGAFQRLAVEMGYDPRRDFKGLKAICTGLTTPPYELKVTQLHEFWGVRVFENYGLVEGGMFVAASCEHGVWDGKRRYPLHFQEHLIHCEVLDPETNKPVSDGEHGELVITTFRREASPAIRYRTRDRVVFASAGSCACGRAFNGYVPGDLSRYDDMRKIKGSTVWPASIDAVVFARREVDEYRVVLGYDDEGREHFKVRVSLHAPFVHDQDHCAALTRELTDSIKRVTLVTPEVEVVDNLPTFEFKAKRWLDER